MNTHIGSSSNRKGFTLIELLVVIAIIGILASIVLASLNTARKKGRDARRVSDIKEIQTALALYKDSNNDTYPTQGTVTTDSASTATALNALVASNYIPTIPTDPTNNSSYFYAYVSTDGTTTPSACSGAGTCTGYILVAHTEVNGVLYSAINTGSISGVTCTVSSAAPYNYCVRD